MVLSSNVNTNNTGGGEASLQLQIPTAHYESAIDQLGQVAAVRAESRNLQDVTNAYNTAARRLADTEAEERRGVLRALAKASTEAQIDSLREQLKLATPRSTGRATRWSRSPPAPTPPRSK